MEKVTNLLKQEEYIEKYELAGLFGQDMTSHMELFMYKKNENICMAGDELTWFLLFVEGCAKVYSPLMNGKILVHRFYHPFKVIGDVELMLNCKVICCIEAVTPVFCLGIRMEVIKELCLKDPVFLKMTSESLAQKLMTFSKSSSINQLYSLENKLAAFILGNIKEELLNGSRTFQWNLSQLSELLGTSYRHLLRTLKNMTAEGILIKHKGYYEILDINKLIKLSADLYE